MAPSDEQVPPFVRLAAHEVRWRLMSELARGDLRVRELVALLGQPQNLVSYHLRQLRAAGLVTARRSSFDGRDSYYHLNLERCAQGLAETGAALHPALRSAPGPASSVAHPPVTTLLFLCTGNSGRSPIAEALISRHSTAPDAPRIEVTSAGSHPKPHMHPGAVHVMRNRYGIDIAGQRPRHLDTMTGRRFDYVITLCDKVREVTPALGTRQAHWSIPDPAALTADGEDSYPAFEQAAAEIDIRIRHLLPVLGSRPGRDPS
ncbi:metalloregulator ArsR/SmtB family transcription factor [Nonomuraea sp. NPDC050691]|uniref:metalloregulator ArsR/SmtB family transcription factor n=1 Tax=Nonomuraea sp. NPDC050691 TaxID=3155661 RepID=UPI00340A260E